MKTRKLQFKSWLTFSALAISCSLATPANAQSTKPLPDTDTTRQELASFDQFLDSHRETAEQLRKDPSLVNNQEFLKNHPALQTYLQQHPQVREEIKESPETFMRKENRFDRPEYSRDRDTTRGELASFDQFLDSHRQTAEQLRKDPSLLNNEQYVKDHPDLQAYLQQHPEVREEIKENSNAFMHQEARYDRTEDATRYERHDANRDRDTARQELANFDQFLDSHRETAEQLRKDPSLVNNEQFVKSHPALQAYLQQHPEVREEVKENPNAFMHQEARYERTENTPIRYDRNDTRDRDTTRGELANFDQFLDSHRETAQQLRKDPSLVNNEQFVNSHPELQAYLQKHPEVREEIKENPNAFMHQEDRYDRRENDVDRDMSHRPSASFGEFLDGHADISKDLSRNPSLAKNDEYMANHPELKEYLNAHPEVRQELLANPQSFVASAQQFNNSKNGVTVKTPAPDSKPKP